MFLVAGGSAETPLGDLMTMRKIKHNHERAHENWAPLRMVKRFVQSQKQNLSGEMHCQYGLEICFQFSRFESDITLNLLVVDLI